MDRHDGCVSRDDLDALDARVSLLEAVIDRLAAVEAGLATVRARQDSAFQAAQMSAQMLAEGLHRSSTVDAA